jgi:AcrR family transcriptional regulator
MATKRAAKQPASRREQEHERELDILRAAITELAVFDYGGMTIESVARRAGVNKTTVYRKWPTKSELVRAALVSIFEMFTVGETVGDLRSDLRRVALKLMAFNDSPEGRTLVRLRLLHHPEPELAEIAQQLRTRKVTELTALMESAVKRGEIAPGVDVKLLLDLLWGVVFVKLVLNREPVDGPTLERILDLLMSAARNGPNEPATGRARRKQGSAKT